MPTIRFALIKSVAQQTYKSLFTFATPMKHASLVIAALLILIAAPLAIAQVPFVEDGRITATIVVGADAPATDVILGAQVASYLQQYAAQVTTGLAATTDMISYDHPQPLILIGTPENNPFVADYLDSSSQGFSGPIVRLDGSRLVLSGRDAQEVQSATNAFMQGTMRLGTVNGAGSPVRPENVPVVVGQQETEPIRSQDIILPIQEELRNTTQECAPERFCRGADIMTYNADCQEVVLRTCEGLCNDGMCVEQERPSFFRRILSALAFWR